MKCITRACSDEVERTGPWKTNKWCMFASAYCLNCMMPYWVLRTKVGERVMDRKLRESFDRRTSGQR